MNTKNKNRLSLAIIGSFLTLGMPGLSAEAAYPAPRGKSPSSRLHTHTKTLDTRIIHQYEAVAEGLVQDDLEKAKKASSLLAETAESDGKSNVANAASLVAETVTLEEARGAFKNLSRHVIELSQGNAEYTVMTCPMVEDGRWLQSGEKVANPYMGSKMPECGMPESKIGKEMEDMKKSPRPGKFK